MVIYSTMEVINGVFGGQEISEAKLSIGRQWKTTKANLRRKISGRSPLKMGLPSPHKAKNHSHLRYLMKAKEQRISSGRMQLYQLLAYD